MTESRSEDDDIEFDEQNIADDNESSNGDPESPTAEAVAKAFLGTKYLVSFSSCSLKTREKYISFAQFVYFLREVCLLFNI